MCESNLVAPSLSQTDPSWLSGSSCLCPSTYRACSSAPLAPHPRSCLSPHRLPRLFPALLLSLLLLFLFLFLCFSFPSSPSTARPSFLPLSPLSSPAPPQSPSLRVPVCSFSSISLAFCFPTTPDNNLRHAKEAIAIGFENHQDQREFASHPSFPSALSNKTLSIPHTSNLRFLRR